MKSIELYVDEYGALVYVFKKNGLPTLLIEDACWELDKQKTGREVFHFLDLKEV